MAWRQHFERAVEEASIELMANSVNQLDTLFSQAHTENVVIKLKTSKHNDLFSTPSKSSSNEDLLLSPSRTAVTAETPRTKLVEQRNDDDDRLSLFKRLISSERLQRQQDEEYEKMRMASALDSTFEPDIEV